MKLYDIAKLRMYNQRITGERFDTPEEVVQHLGAVQAQDYLGALWAVGLRMKKAVQTDIEDALAQRKIIRLWPMRGTLHFVAAEDARWMHTLLTPRLTNAYISRSTSLGLTPEILATAKKVFIQALKGDKQVSRAGLYRIMEEAGLPTKNSLGLHIIGRLAHDGLLCFGPREGKQPTFALFNEWVPSGTLLSREDAVKELVIRYFTGHGPAQIQDLSWWSGLSVKDIREGISLAGAKLTSVEVDGRVYWMGSGHVKMKERKTTAHLLPPFDEFIVAYRDRSASLEAVHAEQVNPGANGMLSSIIVIDGQIVGTWKRIIKKDSIVITCKPFTTFTRAQMKSIEEAGEPYRKFLGLSSVVIAR